MRLALTISLVVWALLVAAPAWAADPVAVPSDLVSILISYAWELVVLPAVVWVAGHAVGWLRQHGWSIAAERLEDGLVMALHWGRDQVEARAQGALSAIQVRNEVVAGAIAYLLPKMPDTLATLGITEDGLRERLEVRYAMLWSEPRTTPPAPEA